MSPPFPTNYDELIQDFNNKGAYSFEFKRANKRNLKNAFDRLNKASTYMRKAKTTLGMLKVLFYNMYIDFLHDFLFRNDQGGKWALVFYRTALHHISSFKGEDKDDIFAKVTFNART